MNWKTTEIDLGTIKPNQKNLINFESYEELDLTHVSASCGCSQAKYIKEQKTLQVEYKSVSIPPHLKSQGYYTTTKFITVIHKSGLKEILKFNAKIQE